MERDLLELEIISPEKQIFKGRVAWVQVPGAKAPFRVLGNHAPLVSTLCAGELKWMMGGEEQQMPVKSGFVEVKNNKVIALIEVNT